VSLPHDIELRIDAPAWDNVEKVQTLVGDAINKALEIEGSINEVVGMSVVLSDDETVRLLNTKWRDRQTATNILSFPAPAGEKTDEGICYIGDMIVAYGVVAKEAENQRKALAIHLCHLVIHGALHLLGHDHLDDETANEMERLETTIMAALKLPDPYLDRQTALAK
jgi:probable rRNA maturation factor